MNIGLYRLHRIFFISYVACVALFGAVGITGWFLNTNEPGLGLIGIAAIPLGILHYYAAEGSRNGRQWARTTSRIVAWVLLVVLPLGTFFAIYIFQQTGKKWQSTEGSDILRQEQHSLAPDDGRSLASRPTPSIDES